MIKYLIVLVASVFGAKCEFCSKELFKYVDSYDPVFSWEIFSEEQRVPGITRHYLRVVSISWPGEPKVWTHQVIVMLPDNCDRTKAVIYLDGDHSTSQPLDVDSNEGAKDIEEIAFRTNVVGVFMLNFSINC